MTVNTNAIMNNQEKIGIPKELGAFRIKDHMLYHMVYDKKKDTYVEHEVGRLVFIKEIRQDVENQAVELELAFFYRGELKTITISRKQLVKNELIKLLEFGVDVPDYKAQKVQQFLTIQEEHAPYVHTHKQLGWSHIEGEEVYKHYSSIGQAAVTSTYNGTFQLEPKGTLEGWMEIIRDKVVPHPPLCLALTAGFAAPVVAWIAKDFDLEVLLIHAYGDSTMGKTTAARVYVSPFGAPTTKEGGCLLKWSGTANGVIGQLVNNHGIPVAIDEASMNNMKDFTEILYVLAEGMEKARMTKELGMRERRKWSGVLWSTAEEQLLSKTNHNTGLKVRLTEVGNIQWTESAVHANQLKDELLQHYGHAGPAFVQYMQEKGKEAIVNQLKTWKQTCLEEMNVKDQYSQRIADKLALLMVTAELVNECLDLKMDIDAILALLIKNEQKTAGQRSVGDLAYSHFQQKLIQYKSKFDTKNFEEKGYEYWGRIHTKGDKVEVAILTTAFKTIMAEGNFDGTDVILKHWRDKGYLDHDHNKLTRKRAAISTSSEGEQEHSTKDQRELFYCVKVPTDLFNREAVQKKKEVKKPKERKVKETISSNPLNDMFSD